MIKSLVTGGAGSIGSEIARQVANYNPQKLIIDLLICSWLEIISS